MVWGTLANNIRSSYRKKPVHMQYIPQEVCPSRQKVKDELQRMENIGVISRVDDPTSINIFLNCFSLSKQKRVNAYGQHHGVWVWWLSLSPMVQSVSMLTSNHSIKV